VKAGMFCTVDIDYRASADRDLQFKMDAEYADNVSFALDVKTFFSIIRTVIKGDNVYVEDYKSDNNEQ
jgi:lipopolysaccharide/colanic/teichoic acid biosynthesis glycosyltransferase